MVPQRFMLVAIIVLLLASVPALSAVPPIINYQGKLLDPATSQPVADGTYRMLFAIYGQETRGSALWSEPNDNVQVKDGLFSVLLGSIINIPANIFDNPDRWFGVKINDDAEMTPRQRLASVPFAFTTAGGVPAGTILPFAGTTAPVGWLLCNGQSVSAATYAALYAAIGTTYGGGGGNFYLPNVQGKFLMGASAAHGLGTFGGSEIKDLQHTHTTANCTLTTAQMPMHSHQLVKDGPKVTLLGDDSGNLLDHDRDGGVVHIDKRYSVSSTQNAGGGAPHNHGNTGSGLSAMQDVLNPFLAVNYIIKY